MGLRQHSKFELTLYLTGGKRQTSGHHVHKSFSEKANAILFVIIMNFLVSKGGDDRFECVAKALGCRCIREQPQQ